MVIDASVGVKWIVPEEDSGAAIKLLDQPNLRVPTLFHCEVGNALWKKARREEIELAPVLPFFASLHELVQTVSELPYAARAAELAVELQHPIYDCIYLAMAEAGEEVLVTADLSFLGILGASRYVEHVRPL